MHPEDAKKKVKVDIKMIKVVTAAFIKTTRL